MSVCMCLCGFKCDAYLNIVRICTYISVKKSKYTTFLHTDAKKKIGKNEVCVVSNIVPPVPLARLERLAGA